MTDEELFAALEAIEGMDVPNIDPEPAKAPETGRAKPARKGPEPGAAPAPKPQGEERPRRKKPEAAAAGSAREGVPSPENRPRRKKPAGEPAGNKAPGAGRSAGGKVPDKKTAGAAPRGKKSGGKKPDTVRITIIAVLAVVAVLVAVVLGLSIAASRVDTIYKGITVGSTDLSGMTVEEAAAAIEAAEAEKYSDLAVTVELPLNNTLTVTAGQAELTISAQEAARQAWEYGRSGGLLKNLMDYAGCRFLDNNRFHCDQPLEVTLNSQAVRAMVELKASEIDSALLSGGVEIGEEDIRITKGAKAMPLDVDALCAMVEQALTDADPGPLVYETQLQMDEAPDFQALYDQVFAEPVDAVYDEETHEITPSVTGVSFDVEQAKKLWDEAEYGDVVIIPLILEEPEYTTESLSDTLFRDILSMDYTMAYLKGYAVRDTVRTSLSGSSSNRLTNVKLACAAINGVILQPGEEFSYNETVGQRTTANGFLPATAYSNGEVTQEVGGGICQVSSTLYNAALYANLEIVERQCHQFQVGYLPWGLDATVSWGWPDLKFKNNTEYPIQIKAWVDTGTNECCVQILGTNVDQVFVVMRFNNWEYYDDTDTYFDASGKPLAIGMKATTWRLVYPIGADYMDRNAAISNEVESYSTYSYHKEDIEARHVPTPSPTPDPGTVTPTPSASPTPTPGANTPSPTPVVTPSPTPVVTPSPTPEPTPAPTPAPTPEPTPEPPPDSGAGDT